MKRALQLALRPLLALALAGMARAQSATVMTDHSDYAPGTIVTITGSGWQPGETVTLSFVESPLIDTHPDLYATADPSGNIFNNQFSPDSHDVDVMFTLTATGQASGLQAQTTFTDGNVQKISALGSQTPSPVLAGAQATYSVTVSFNGNNNPCTSTLTTSGLPTGATGSFSNNPFTSTGTNQVSTLTVTTAPSISPGSTTFTITASGSNGCSGTASTGTGGNPANPTLVVADNLVFGQQPSNTSGGATISPAVTVRVVDANNNLITTGVGSTASVTIAIGNNAGGGTLSGTLTKNAVGGIATFNDLSIDRAGTGYTLVASGTNLVNTTSGAFNITVGAAAKLAFTTSPSNSTGGVAFPTQPVVTLQDEGGNTVTGTAQNVTVAIQNNAGPGGVLSGTTTVAVNTSTGRASFSGLSINKAGNGYTLTATGNTVSATAGVVVSAPFNITAGNLDHFGFATIGAQTTGVAFNVTITAQDTNNNTVTAFTGNNNKVMLTSTGTLVGAPVTSGGFTNGVLSGQSVTITNTGTFTITATGVGGNSGITGTSNSFAVNPAAPSKLVFASTPITVIAGVCSTALTLQSQDTNGNPSNVTSTETLSPSASPSAGASFYTDNACTTPVTGSNLTIASGSNTATFYFKDTSAGSVLLTVSGTGAFTTGSGTNATQTETVNAAAARRGQTIVAMLLRNERDAFAFRNRQTQ